MASSDSEITRELYRTAARELHLADATTLDAFSDDELQNSIDQAVEICEERAA